MVSKERAKYIPRFPLRKLKGDLRMKTLKKTLALLLAVAMLLAMTACGGNAPAAPETEPKKEETAPVVEEPVAAAPVISVTEESTYKKPLPNVPEVPYWFPADLLNWVPNENGTDVYNISSIPLAERVADDKLSTVNATQNKDVKVLAISIMNASTSGNAPHALNTANANIFTFWQYVDTLVYWGGSSGEGLIVTPSADVIDAGHKNGVPVLGTVFFPQAAHGGKLEWLEDFLTKDESGNFPIIPKLIEVCEYFGFDGWFINQETEGTEENPLTAEHAAAMKEFIVAFKAAAGDDLQLVWYDSMTEVGEMDWQNALTDKNKYFVIGDDQEKIADSMFLNFWWNTNTYEPDELLKATAEKAAELGVDPYDMYAGIDVQANGTNTKVRWHLYAPEGQAPYTSLGLYCPSWTFFSANDFFTDFQEREGVMWVNQKQDPYFDVTPEVGEWAGVSTWAVENTVVNSVPFITNFSMGNGYNFFIDGEKVSDKDWNNRSVQDVLPTYRWHIEQGEGTALEAIMDYSNAWYGGTSMKLYGKMAAGKAATAKLYSSDLAVTEGLSFTAKVKASSELNLDLVVTLADGTTEIIPADNKVTDAWSTVSFDVSGLVGKTISGFDIRVTSDTDVVGVKFYLGQIAITDPAVAPEAQSAADLKVDSTSFDDDDCIYTGVCLSWTGNADLYEIWRVNQDGSVSFIDVTPSTALYINALERNDDTNKTNFKVIPVDIYGNRGTESNVVTMDWPDNSLPKANFMASATLVAPGQEITFTSLCSVNTETVSWEFPGASVETSTDAAPVVSYAEEGTYTVKVTAKNASGEAVEEKVGLITVTSKVTGDLLLVSAGMETSASAYVNDNEAPPFAVDGDYTKKWCATGNPPHTLTIDLGEVKVISEVKIFHAEAGNESPDMNTKAYTIQVSEDGETFVDVVKVTKNTAGQTSDTFAAVNARYVKLVVEKPTQGSDTAARIYEVEVYGLNEAL